MARTMREETRPQTPPRPLLRCIEPFAIYRDGVPDVFNADREVFDDDPILKTHRHHFEPAAARLLKRTQVEQTTAAPGQYRSVATTPTASTAVEASDE